MKSTSILFFAILFLASCDSGPKIIKAETETVNAGITENSLPVFKDVPNSAPPMNNEEHQVVVKEILNTDKYSYLNVTENDEKFWIAVTKRDVTIGDTYYYKGGLLKRHFFSKEFNRVFDKVFLVSNIWKKSTIKSNEVIPEKTPSNIPAAETLSNVKVGEIELKDGSVPLAELFAQKEKYDGQSITITGKCVKINPMIMNRNWLHIQDGSGEGLDLTVTTTEKVPLGAVVSLKGTVAVDKDFGAGYRYDIIMEGAVLQ